MITITKTTPFDFSGLRLKYAIHRKIISRLVLPVTRFFRAMNTERYLRNGNRLLDIGCGDGYFIERNINRYDEIIGLDRLLGDTIEKTLPFPDNYFDCVTMLAVIEHFNYPWDILGEIKRVLKPGGRCVFTTPKKSAEWLINLYVKEIHDEHKYYFDEDTIRMNATGFKLVAYDTFIFGLNQVFCLEKL